MLPREFIEEFFGRPGAAALHVLQTLPDPPKGLLIILSLPFEVFGRDVVEGRRRCSFHGAGQTLRVQPTSRT